MLSSAYCVATNYKSLHENECKVLKLMYDKSHMSSTQNRPRIISTK